MDPIHFKTRIISGKYRLDLIIPDVCNSICQTASQIFHVVLIWKKVTKYKHTLLLLIFLLISLWCSWPQNSLYIRHSVCICLYTTCAPKDLKSKWI